MAQAEQEQQDAKQTSPNEISTAGLDSGSQAPPSPAHEHCPEKEKDNDNKSVEEARDSSPDQSPSPVPRRERRKVSFWRFLLMYHRNEVTALVALLCTLLSSFLQIQSGASKDKLLRRSAPVAQRFFPRGSAVLDLFDGNNGDTLTLMSKAEVVLLMYYAPWCAECQEMRWHLDKLARNFSPLYQVKFVGINCWDPGGKCKQSYKLYTYPVLAVYPGTSQALFYTGHLSLDYLYRFVEGVLSPLVRLQNSDEIEDFLATSDICLVAFFDFASSPDPPGYLNFHKTALKYLEKDPMGSIRFGLITQPDLASRELNMTASRDLRLYQLRHYYDSTDFASFPKNVPFRSAEILKWTFGQLQTPHSDGPAVMWVPVGAPLGQKNDHLQDILREGPTAILFTPRDPLTESVGLTPDYAVFRHVALEYLDCTWGEGKRMRRARTETRKAPATRHSVMAKWARQCRDKVAREKKLKACCQEVVLTTVQAPINRNICDICTSSAADWGFRKPSLLHLDSPPKKDPQLHGGLLGSESPESEAFSAAVSGRSCDELSVFLPASALVDYCCHPRQRRVMLDGGLWEERRLHCDHKCLGDGGKWRNEFGDMDGCRKLRLAKLLGSPVRDDIDDAFDGEASRHFYGLGCETNKTLRFVAMDRRHYSWMADKIRPVSSHPSDDMSSKVVIVDNSTESQYIFSGRLTLSGLRSFIENFTVGHLESARVSEVPSSPLRQASSLVRDPGSSSDQGRIKVERVNSNSFLRTVVESDRDVIVFYTGGAWCGFCSSVFHVFLAAAAYFRDLNDKLTFAKIDGSENDLPWQYRVDRYPSIVFFPRLRKTESVTYPEFLPITLPNLLSFVLAQSHPEIRWRTGLGVCSKACRRRNRVRMSEGMAGLRTSIRVLKAQLRDRVREWRRMEDYESEYWNMDDDGRMFHVFIRELRKDLARKETQLKILSTFLRLLQDLDAGGHVREAIFLEFLVKHNWAVPFSDHWVAEQTNDLLR